MRRLIYLLLSVTCMVLFFTYCFSPDFKPWSDKLFGSLSVWVNLFYSFSFIISIGLYFMSCGLPFTDVFFESDAETRARAKSGGSGDFGNIQDFIKYRNGLMGGMTPESSAKLMMDTAVADAISNGSYSGANTRDTANYINGMLGGISPENQINFLKGKG